MSLVRASTKVRFAVALYDPQGALTDPATVDGWVRYEDDPAETSLPLTRESLGHYAATYVVPRAGRLRWGVRCTNPEIVAESALHVWP
jgi:hypothetical protein